jgi:5-formyltetrahydrofolate cyclo-ligase
VTTFEPKTPVMKKSDIREKALAERKSWTQQDFELKNVQLLNQIIEFLNPLPRNLMLMSFHSMEQHREIMTAKLHELLIHEPFYHQLIFPKVEKNMSQLIPYLTDKKSIFVRSDWGILEPTNDTSVQLNPKDINLIFIPLLAIDTQGHRVGYGKGFYDRFLANTKPELIKIGLCLEEPIEPIEDLNSFDIAMDFAITPKSVYRFR